jgi:SAM-dependent methyltransferase
VGGPPGELAMDRLELLPGRKVVDLGCGTGRTTLELASRVGPGGEAVGADISADMLARGRERAARLGIGNVEFVHADIQVHDFGASRCDAADSRFGVMFFTGPVTAFANVGRALRPGGVLSFGCWQGVFDNEWMLIPGAAVAEVTGSLPPMPGPDEPGPFSLADPGRVRAVLDAAGFGSVTITPHADHIVISEDRIPRGPPWPVPVRAGFARRSAMLTTALGSERSPPSSKPCAAGWKTAKCEPPGASCWSPPAPEQARRRAAVSSGRAPKPPLCAAAEAMSAGRAWRFRMVVL